MKKMERGARFSLLCLLGAGLFMALLPREARSQVLYGSVTGAVTDASGAVVPGVQVTITNETTGLTRTGTTDANGRYRLLDLPEGSYTINASASGFQAVRKTGIPVVIGQVNEQDLQLAVGSTTQEVTVQASAATLQTQKADVHTTISSFAIENLPTDPYRNFQTAELLAPGVFSDSQITKSYPNSYTDTPDRSLNIDANGLPPRINTTRVDGATNIFIWLPNHMLVIPPQDTIQEVNVQTADYDVEKGLTAGVATDVVTKSGTNAVHGTLYGFHSDNALDASNVFYPGNQRKAKHIQNQDGGTVGGPIKKDKLFYFANWEGSFERNNYSAQATLPPIADGSAISNWRGGDFSSALSNSLFDAKGNPINVCTTEGGTTQLRQGMVFDPATGNADGTNRCVFSSGGNINVIPASRLNPGTVAYWGLLPTPNYFPLGHVFNSNTTSNYFISTTDRDTRQIFGGRIDWNRSDKHTIWGHYMGQNFNAVDPPWYGKAGGGYATGQGHQYATTMTLGHTWTLSPTMVLTGNVGFTRMSENSRPPTFGKPLGESLLGIPGANAPDGDPLYTGMTGIYMSGFATLGDANSWEPVFRNDWTGTTSHNVTWVRKSHEIRFGVDISHNHLNHWQPEIFCCPRGYVNFYEDGSGLDLPTDAKYAQMPVFTKTGGALTAAGTGFSTDRQNAVALFDLGIVSESSKSRQYIKNTAKDTQFGLYIGDRWKVTPKFTADLGLRYEYFPLIIRDGRIKFERYDPATNETLLGGVAGNPVHLGATSSKKLFTPRLGLAYRFGDKTVFRTGFGLSNDTLPLERPLRGFFPLSLGADNVVPDNGLYSQFQNLSTFAQGIPLLADPDISKGQVIAPNTVDVGTLGPGEFKRAYIESWNAFVERQLPHDFLLNVGYVGNHYVHEMNGRDLNPATLGGGSASQPLYAAFKRTAGTYQFQGYLGSHYNALQVMLSRHYSQGLFVQGSYTWSKVISYTNDNSWENALSFNCPPSPALPQGCQEHNRGVASFDHTQMLKMAFVYELPFGAGKKFATGERVSNAILGGWQLNGVFSGWTGSPLTLTASGSRLHTPHTTQTPNEVAGIKYPKGQGPGQFWFDTTSFLPVLTNNVLGTMGRTPSWLRGPGLVQMDASLFRHFKLTERYDLELRAEAQNLTNSPHFNNPHTSCSNINGACGGSFGQITGGYGQRYIQLGLKVRF